MNEQPSIFDDSFDAAVAIRRRDLMPGFLKFYLLVMFFIGIIAFSFRVYTLVRMYQFYSGFGYKGTFFSNTFYLMTAKSVITWGAITAMVICLWFEWKWAIRFSWGVLIYWLLITITDFVTGYNYNLYAGVSGLILAPFYATLYQIQKRWEREAVRLK